MHLETLLYMLLQSDKAVPPPGVRPDFESLAEHARANSIPNDWIKIPERTLTIGMDDPGNDEGPTRYYGWDNEKSNREITVHSFEAQARPLTNSDYARYLEANDIDRHPASWTSTDPSTKTQSSNVPKPQTNGTQNPPSASFLRNKAVKTVYGAVPLAVALDWPVVASYDELAGCARWMQGRIPTADEARSIYAYAEELRSKHISFMSAQTIPAVNGCVTPCSRFSRASGRPRLPRSRLRAETANTLSAGISPTTASKRRRHQNFAL